MKNVPSSLPKVPLSSAFAFAIGVVSDSQPFAVFISLIPSHQLVPLFSRPQTFVEVSDDLSRTALEWRDRLQQLSVLPTPADESFSGAVDEHLRSLDHLCRELEMTTM